MFFFGDQYRLTSPSLLRRLAPFAFPFTGRSCSVDQRYFGTSENLYKGLTPWRLPTRLTLGKSNVLSYMFLNMIDMLRDFRMRTITHVEGNIDL